MKEIRKGHQYEVSNMFTKYVGQKIVFAETKDGIIRNDGTTDAEVLDVLRHRMLHKYHETGDDRYHRSYARLSEVYEVMVGIEKQQANV